MKAKHSEFGLAACAWAALVLLWFLYWGIRMGVPEASRAGGPLLYHIWRSFSSFLFVMSHLYFRVQIASLIGIALAMVGLLQPSRRRLSAIAGLALNAAMLLWAISPL